MVRVIFLKVHFSLGVENELKGYIDWLGGSGAVIMQDDLLFTSVKLIESREVGRWMDFS